MAVAFDENFIRPLYAQAATAERAQQMVGECQRAHGIKPEDNIFSRGIIAARDQK